MKGGEIVKGDQEQWWNTLVVWQQYWLGINIALW
jgi:hypothetical protein